MRGALDHRPYTAVWEKLQLIASTQVHGRVLDAGAADGQYVVPWRDRTATVVALDIDATRIAQLRRGFAATPDVTVVRGSVERLPFTDRAFDIVWASEILEHLTSLDALDELERVSNRLIVATMPSPTGPYRYLDRTHRLRYSARSLRVALASRAGWEYRLEGLGGCLPAWTGTIPLRRAWLALSRERPWLAWTIVVVGRRAGGDASPPPRGREPRA